MNGMRVLRSLSVILLVIVVLGMLASKSSVFIKEIGTTKQMNFGELARRVKDGEVESLVITNDIARAELKKGVGGDAWRYKHTVVLPDSFALQKFYEMAQEHVKTIDIKRSIWQGVLGTVVVSFLLPVLFIVALYMFIARQNAISGNQALSFGRSRAKRLTDNMPKVTFEDVAGVEEAKQELEEVVEFLKHPEKFQALGAKIPKGVLLLGPPGCGKTLLARAIAGEAGVPFFHISGSDFVEMFVGVGASRVRDLFDQAKAHRPCLVFIDEIDAVGRHRGAGLGGGHDEREQTLNQLLVEMDGFDPNIGVILIAATNRPDVLDPALLRPGRFDRRIVVDNPDAKGRKEILKVHTKGKPLANDVDLELLARRTPGFSGADLANLVNEAALLAARRNKTQISRPEFEDSVERVAMGPERKSRLIKDKEKRVTAYHEGGHALVAKLLPDSDPVHKVTILPRGMAMGYVLSLPEDDRYMASKSELLSKITMALGGRVAEEVVLGDITTGAESDLQYATEKARQMICEFGMSDNLGPLSLGRRHGPVFLGRDLYEERNYSEEVAAQIDKEIRAIVEECYAKAKELIETNRDKLERIVVALLEKETIDGDELDAIINGTERPDAPPPTAAAPITPDVSAENEPRRTPQPRPKPGLAGA